MKNIPLDINNHFGKHNIRKRSATGITTNGPSIGG